MAPRRKSGTKRPPCLAMAEEHKSIQDVLNRIDWNFPGASTSEGTVHALHWFPGNFIPEVPTYLIQLLTRPNDLVVDPFCGSGTTAVEALRLGRRAWQSDANRAALQVAQGKIAASFESGQEAVLHRLIRELTWESLLRSDASGSKGEGSDPELLNWIEDDTLRQLKHLWTLVDAEKLQSPMRAILEMIFTDTLFRCARTQARTRTGSPRKHHWGWTADNVRLKEPAWCNAIFMFRRALETLVQIPRVTDASDSVTTRREEICALSLAPGTADLIVTSPPYLGVIDYTLGNRLTYLWMGWSMEEDRKAEIGARRHRTSEKAAERYWTVMRSAGDRFATSLRNGGHCAVIIGSSRRFPGAAQKVTDIIGHRLQLIWGPVERLPTRRRVSDRFGTQPRELVHRR